MRKLEQLIDTLPREQLDEKLFETEEYRELTEAQKNHIFVLWVSRLHDISPEELTNDAAGK